MPGELLVLRADAGPAIGMGHIMRCLAIAQAWIDLGGRATFAVAEGAPFVEAYGDGDITVTPVEARRGSVADIMQTAALASYTHATCVVLDGYAFGVDFQERLARVGRCVVVDDHARLPTYLADLVVDPNIGAEEELYHRRSRARVLAGLRYALLRREFRAHRHMGASVDDASDVLVTFGGADEACLTERALAGLPRDLKVTVLIGVANNRRRDIELAAAGRRRTRVVYDARNIPDLMAGAVTALSAGGGTCAEFAFMGVPTVVVTAAENQRPVVKGFEKLGTVEVLGDAANVTGASMGRAIALLLADVGARATMSALGKAAVDGLGAVRVAEAIRKMTS